MAVAPGPSERQATEIGEEMYITNTRHQDLGPLSGPRMSICGAITFDTHLVKTTDTPGRPSPTMLLMLTAMPVTHQEPGE